MRWIIRILFLVLFLNTATAQERTCFTSSIKNSINSKELNETRDYWVSLPLNYSDSLDYPVIYVLDAEWRFDLVKNIAFDLGGNNKIQKSIIVGIPHVDWKNRRGKDLTFSQSRIEYDGEAVDSTWYNSLNSGGGNYFYNYLANELIPDVNKNFSTNGHETLIGHSYGGYFGGYLLSLDHPFEVLHIYDPSAWYSNGEIIKKIQNRDFNFRPVRMHITYQPKPAFHKQKIEEFIEQLMSIPEFSVTRKCYKEETHNSLFLDSFYTGIQLTNQ